MSNFQVCYNGTRIDTEPMKFGTRYQFGIFLPNKEDNDTIIKFTLWGIATGATIRNPRNKYLDTLPVYKIKIPLFWDTAIKSHAKNKEAVHKGAAINKRRWLIVVRGKQHEGENRSVNILDMWLEYADNLLMPMMCLSDSPSSFHGTDYIT